MAFEQRNNSGQLFRNDRREKENQPHATGNAVIDGVSYRVSAWTKTSANGTKFQSLSFTRKEANNAPATRKEPAKSSYAAASGRDEGGLADELDDLPF